MSSGETEACQEADDWAAADLTNERKETESLSDNWVSSHISPVVCMCKLFSWVKLLSSNTLHWTGKKNAFHVLINLLSLPRSEIFLSHLHEKSTKHFNWSFLRKNKKEINQCICFANFKISRIFKPCIVNNYVFSGHLGIHLYWTLIYFL